MGPTRLTIFVTCIILIVGGIHLTTLREGHDWGDDFSMYIHHAKNIAQGIDYGKTGYLANPSYPTLSPESYPPIFPLVLSPVYRWSGLDLMPMKLVIVLFFLGSLFLIFLLFRNELPPEYVIAMVAVLGLNPYFWEVKDQILSDVPFLFFLCLSLILMGKAHPWPTAPKRRALLVMLIGISVYLAYGTRSIGIILIPSLLLADVLERKRPLRASVLAASGVVILIVLQSLFLHSDTTYVALFDRVRPGLMYQKVLRYVQSLGLFWDNGYSQKAALGLFVLMTGLAALGYAFRSRKKITMLEILPVLYCLPLTIAPFERGVRYLIPVIPFYVFFAFVGIKEMRVARRPGAERAVLAVVLVGIFVSYAFRYTTLEYGPMTVGIGRKETREVFDYLQKNTEERDVLLFIKPRALALFTGRTTSAYHRIQGEEGLWEYLQAIHARYIIDGRLRAEQDNQAFLRRVIARYEEHLEKVYSNPDFKVYRIRGVLAAEAGGGGISRNGGVREADDPVLSNSETDGRRGGGAGRIDPGRGSR